ncbi:MAG TPA: GNAT family N-acetyltransferase [Negativicutes bacterium]|nr:GNAT family N-acetyltransferase [Negativicutes bacterium]
MNYELANASDAGQIANIHKEEIKKGFLSSLPMPFLTKIYAAIIESPAGFCVVAKENGVVVGLIAGTASVKQFYGFFLRKYFFYSVGVLFLRMARFSQLKKMVETLLYPVKETTSPEAELLTMAVAKKIQGQGIAGNMLKEFTRQMESKNIREFKVLVGEELAPAIRFYEKNGFVFLRNISIHDNKKTRIYVYHIS